VRFPWDPLPLGSTLFHQLWADPALIHRACVSSEKVLVEDGFVGIETVMDLEIDSVSVVISLFEQMH
jgi:hypothetical protein